MAKTVLALSPTDGTTWGSIGTSKSAPVVFTASKAGDGTVGKNPVK